MSADVEIGRHEARPIIWCAALRQRPALAQPQLARLAHALCCRDVSAMARRQATTHADREGTGAYLTGPADDLARSANRTPPSP